MKDCEDEPQSQNIDKGMSKSQTPVKEKSLNQSGILTQEKSAKIKSPSKKITLETTGNPNGTSDLEDSKASDAFWKKRDDKRLKKAVSKYHKQGFSRIAQEVGRTNSECRARYHILQKRIQDKKIKKSKNLSLKINRINKAPLKDSDLENYLKDQNKVSIDKSTNDKLLQKSKGKSPEKSEETKEAVQKKPSGEKIPASISGMKKVVIRNKKKEKPLKVKKPQPKKNKRKKVSKRVQRNEMIKQEELNPIMEMINGNKKSDQENEDQEPQEVHEEQKNTEEIDLNASLNKILTENGNTRIKQEVDDFNPAVKLSYKSKPEEEKKYPSLQTLFNKNTSGAPVINEEKQSDSSLVSGKLPSLNNIIDTCNKDHISLDEPMTPVLASQEQTISKEIVDNNKAQESLELLNRRLSSNPPPIDQEMPPSTNLESSNNQSNEKRMLFGSPRVDSGIVSGSSPNGLQGNLQSFRSVKQEVLQPTNSMANSNYCNQPVSMPEQQQANLPEMHQAVSSISQNNMIRIPNLNNGEEDPDYELYGFVYKIKVHEVPSSRGCSFKRLKRIELLYNDQQNRLENIPFTHEVGRNGHNANPPMVTVYPLPTPNESDDHEDRDFYQHFSQILSHLSMNSSIYERARLIFD
ncbi:unnamed protein product [Moneuplotes crassus]|uniref:SANT domain-containing protein n=1 Tax=Euplotes crassus TaxID=5936 RepID=A0AAD1U316_EUPCR|nr:unnamed protein product [Moneuplotes crassus]